ncbi:MAG: NAD(P)/FAD-dependent oxidoreductase [Sandaracinus sp.]|nr:NAD(P)/FAD-dependent oxidoreductase [Sandaracinus sp.]MCB9623756.1 NAD(P)/FAD-dependent oxidoreductase [Sandaracinus sp.]
MEGVDVVIVGGGPAGLSAALCLGRARRKVVVLDAGSPRHAVSEGVHNFLSREGIAPAALRDEAWAQMAAYPSVRRVEARVSSLNESEGRWWASDGERSWRARAAILATGVIDEHPSIPGYRERFGHAIFLCPFCHGWEMRDRPLAVLASGEGATHLGRLLRGWTNDVVVLTNGGPLDDEARATLERARVAVDERRVVALEGEGRALERVRFEDGDVLERRGLFVVTAQRQVPLVEGLGLELDAAGYVTIDAQMQTSRAGLHAAGDLTSRMQQVVESAAQGLRAGALVHAKLTFEEVG